MQRSAFLAAGAAAALFATPAFADIDRAAAEQALSEAAALCDGGRALWRETLCGPMLIADPQTRQVVANRGGPGLDASGKVFLGVLPANLPIANTAVEWNGRRWTMVMSTALADDAYDRASLLMHEAWHRAQLRLGFPAHSPTADHLATPMARALMRLEWRALAVALVTADESVRLQAIGDALAFREFRRWTETAPETERRLEMNEGLAEYTGLRLSGRPKPEAHLARTLARMEKGDSFARSFAYGTGPAYGLLLDRYARNWTRRLKPGDDLGKLLERAVGSRRLGGHVNVTEAQARYAGEQVFADERQRHEQHRKAEADWTAKLVTGPVLRLPFAQMNFSFDPNAVFPLPPHGSVYPSTRISDAWGVLTVEGGGALIDPNFGGVTVAAPAADGGLSGPGWRLELAPGWELVRGAGSGDWGVRKAR